MSKRPSQRWLISLTPKAQRQLRKLTPELRRAVFVSIRYALEVEDPLRTARKVVAGQYQGAWRLKDNPSDPRVFFYLEVGSIIRSETEYKGILMIIGIEKRDEQTYQ